MITLYHFGISGNAYKVRLMLSLLDLRYEAITSTKGQHKQPAYLQLNPLGQVPLLVEGDTVIRDSQVILVYLARRYGGEEWLPLEAEPIARVMQRLSLAANEIQQGLAATRRYYLLNAKLDLELAEQNSAVIKNFRATLARTAMARECNRLTIADIACFPYVALAGDGEIYLEPYSNVLAWIERIKQLPRFVELQG